MKKIILLTAVLCLALTLTAFGEGVKDKKFVSGYLGYTLGFGDAFADEEEVILGTTYKYSFSAGINLGGAFHYGLSEKMMVGGELGFQSYKAEASAGSISTSSSDFEMNILATALYVLNYEEENKGMFLNFGAGLYGGGESNLGLFGGIVYHKELSQSYDVIFMPRIHYILADDVKPIMLSLSVGISLPIGEKK